MGRSPSLSYLKLLRALLDDPLGPHYGLELIERSGVKAGALYPLLARLEEEGLVVGEWENIDESVVGRRKRRYYRLTGVGVKTANDMLAEAAGALMPPGLIPRWAE